MLDITAPYSLFTVALEILFTITTSLLLNFGQGQLYGGCPVGYYADGSCATLHVCIDPHERCLNGICCQQMEMPFGYGNGFPLPAGQIGPIIGGGAGSACFDWEESCINFVHRCNVQSVAQVCAQTCGLCNNNNNGPFPYGQLPYGGAPQPPLPLLTTG